jgi:hypothetical protein
MFKKIIIAEPGKALGIKKLNFNIKLVESKLADLNRLKPLFDQCNDFIREIDIFELMMTVVLKKKDLLGINILRDCESENKIGDNIFKKSKLYIKGLSTEEKKVFERMFNLAEGDKRRGFVLKEVDKTRCVMTTFKLNALLSKILKTRRTSVLKLVSIITEYYVSLLNNKHLASEDCSLQVADLRKFHTQLVKNNDLVLETLDHKKLKYSHTAQLEGDSEKKADLKEVFYKNISEITVELDQKKYEYEQEKQKYETQLVKSLFGYYLRAFPQNGTAGDKKLFQSVLASLNNAGVTYSFLAMISNKPAVVNNVFHIIKDNIVLLTQLYLIYLQKSDHAIEKKSLAVTFFNKIKGDLKKDVFYSLIKLNFNTFAGKFMQLGGSEDFKNFPEQKELVLNHLMIELHKSLKGSPKKSAKIIEFMINRCNIYLGRLIPDICNGFPIGQFTTEQLQFFFKAFKVKAGKDFTTFYMQLEREFKEHHAQKMAEVFPPPKDPKR